MIELTFVDEKPKVTINGKEVKVFPRREEGCIYVGDPENIGFKDIENVKLLTIPDKIFLFYLNVENSQEEKLFLVDFISIKKIDNNNFTLELNGVIEPGKWNIKYFYPIFEKQYLSYFEKFLLDNGVVCALSLIDKNDITYMNIKLNESTINIDNLKEALVGYFSLPILAEENMYFESQDIKIQQLLANVEHLKSQLRLANLTISQYEQLSLSTPVEYVIIDSLHKDNAIELYDGLIKIKKMIKLKLFGIDIELDIPLLLEKIKNKL